jgi:hypothetical protein
MSLFPAAPPETGNLRNVGAQPTEQLNPSRFISMRRRPKDPQLANIVFLDKVGGTLRQVTSDTTREEATRGHPAAAASVAGTILRVWCHVDTIRNPFFTVELMLA